MVVTEDLHKEIIHTLANTFIYSEYQLMLQPHILH